MVPFFAFIIVSVIVAFQTFGKPKVRKNTTVFQKIAEDAKAATKTAADAAKKAEGFAQKEKNDAVSVIYNGVAAIHNASKGKLFTPFMVIKGEVFEGTRITHSGYAGYRHVNEVIKMVILLTFFGGFAVIAIPFLVVRSIENIMTPAPNRLQVASNASGIQQQMVKDFDESKVGMFMVCGDKGVPYTLLDINGNVIETSPFRCYVVEDSKGWSFNYQPTDDGTKYKIPNVSGEVVYVPITYTRQYR